MAVGLYQPVDEDAGRVYLLGRNLSDADEAVDFGHDLVRRRRHDHVEVAHRAAIHHVAEAIAEGHGKAQADTLRKSRTTVTARRYDAASKRAAGEVAATELALGDLVIVKAGETVPADGEVVEGVASVDESAITGERAVATGVPSRAAHA